jgi:hypothetical protein
MPAAVFSAFCGGKSDLKVASAISCCSRINRSMVSDMVVKARQTVQPEVCDQLREVVRNRRVCNALLSLGSCAEEAPPCHRSLALRSLSRRSRPYVEGGPGEMTYSREGLAKPDFRSVMPLPPFASTWKGANLNEERSICLSLEAFQEDPYQLIP